jgi:hypothetical protein
LGRPGNRKRWSRGVAWLRGWRSGNGLGVRGATAARTHNGERGG